MLRTAIGFGSVKFNQGNDDMACMMSCSHVTSEVELTELAEVFGYNGEFGAEMLSQLKYDRVPTVVEFSTTELAKDKGTLVLTLVFENGKKHTLTLFDYLNDDTLIADMKTAILAKSSGAFGVPSKVSQVNESFTKNKN